MQHHNSYAQLLFYTVCQFRTLSITLIGCCSVEGCVLLQTSTLCYRYTCGFMSRYLGKNLLLDFLYVSILAMVIYREILSYMYIGTIPKSADSNFCTVCSSVELTLQNQPMVYPQYCFTFNLIGQLYPNTHGVCNTLILLL